MCRKYFFLIFTKVNENSLIMNIVKKKEWEKGGKVRIGLALLFIWKIELF